MKRAYICSYTEQVTLWSRHTINYPGLGNKFRYATQAAGFFLYTMLDVTHRMPLLRKKWKLEVFPQNKKTSLSAYIYYLHSGVSKECEQLLPCLNKAAISGIMEYLRAIIFGHQKRLESLNFWNF